MVRSVRRCVAMFGLATALAAPVVPALAQSRPAAPPAEAAPASGKVDVEVMVIHANNDAYVDPKLDPVMQNLRHTRYTGFKLLSTENAKLSPGGDTTISLVGGRRLKIQLVSRDQQQAKVRIRMFKEGDKVLDTTVSIPRGRYFMIAGPKYKDGALILPVGVDY